MIAKAFVDWCADSYPISIKYIYQNCFQLLSGVTTFSSMLDRTFLLSFLNVKQTFFLLNTRKESSILFSFRFRKVQAVTILMQVNVHRLIILSWCDCTYKNMYNKNRKRRKKWELFTIMYIVELKLTCQTMLVCLFFE